MSAHSEAVIRYQKRNPEKFKAQKMAQTYPHLLIIKFSCEHDKPKTNHHPDYKKWREVEKLCGDCHREVHRRDKLNDISNVNCCKKCGYRWKGRPTKNIQSSYCPKCRTKLWNIKTRNGLCCIKKDYPFWRDKFKEFFSDRNSKYNCNALSKETGINFVALYNLKNGRLKFTDHYINKLKPYILEAMRNNPNPLIKNKCPKSK